MGLYSELKCPACGFSIEAYDGGSGNSFGEEYRCKIENGDLGETLKNILRDMGENAKVIAQPNLLECVKCGKLYSDQVISIEARFGKYYHVNKSVCCRKVTRIIPSEKWAELQCPICKKKGKKVVFVEKPLGIFD